MSLLNILIRILANMKIENPKNMKQIYMERVPEFETEDEVMPNRLILRRYLKELVVNQKRIH